MGSGKYSALSGAIAREQSIANISANLANVSTTGYKRRSLSFAALLKGEQQSQQARGINYSKVNTARSDFSAGPLRQTDNPLDVAIGGEGFFKVQGPDGPRYTRRGDFVVDAAGILRTSNGMAVLNEGNGEITVPNPGSGQIAISEEGIISLLTAGGARNEVGQLALVTVDDPQKLKREENTTFSLGEGAAEIPLETRRVVQGSLELANVNMTEEMTLLIDSFRTFETYHKVLESYKTLGEQQDELGTIG